VITVVLVLVSIAFCVTLGILLFGSRRGSPPAPKFREQLEAEIQSRTALQLDLEKRKKELDESRHQLSESREQLKQAKKKLFEKKESERDSRHLAHERNEIERSASVQLERVRLELSHAQVEIHKLKTDLEGSRSRRNAPPAPVAAPAHVPEPAAAAVSSPALAEKPVRKFRELTDADRERMQRLEQQATRERTRAGELERELKRFRARTETQHRVYVVTKGELDLVKDKFKALEKRLNRTLLERDLVGRALRDLERRSGIAAERTELTAEEIAASDRTVEEKAAVASAEAERVNAAAKAQAEREEREREKAAQESHASTEASADHEASAKHTDEASADHPVGSAS
jgi:hypothetical protein